MLKIKDNVDLKEIEKFGAKKEKDFYIFQWKDMPVLMVDKNRRIYGYLKLQNDYEFDILFDLIQAGLVEKV